MRKDIVYNRDYSKDRFVPFKYFDDYLIKVRGFQPSEAVLYLWHTPIGLLEEQLADFYDTLCKTEINGMVHLLTPKSAKELGGFIKEPVFYPSVYVDRCDFCNCYVFTYQSFLNEDDKLCCLECCNKKLGSVYSLP